MYSCFKKYRQRTHHNFDNEYIKTRQIQTYLDELYKNNPFYTQSNSSNKLFIIGHSLNESDADVIKELFSICSNLVVYYHNSQTLGKYIDNLTEIFGRCEFENMRQKGKLIFTPLETKS